MCAYLSPGCSAAAGQKTPAPATPATPTPADADWSMGTSGTYCTSSDTSMLPRTSHGTYPDSDDSDDSDDSVTQEVKGSAATRQPDGGNMGSPFALSPVPWSVPSSKGCVKENSPIPPLPHTLLCAQYVPVLVPVLTLHSPDREHRRAFTTQCLIGLPTISSKSSDPEKQHGRVFV